MVDDHRHPFAKRIEHRLIDLQMSKSDLAVEAGISRQALYDFLQGRTSKLPPDMDFAAKIAKVLNLHLPDTHASRESGGYDRLWFDDLYAGTFRTLKLSPRDPSKIVSFRTQFWWDKATENANFREIGRSGSKNHTGRFASLQGSSVVYLLSKSAKGRGFRQITLTRNEESGSLLGYLSSVFFQQGKALPFVTPIVYIRDEQIFSDGVHESASPSGRLAIGLIAEVLSANRALILLPN